MDAAVSGGRRRRYRDDSGAGRERRAKILEMPLRSRRNEMCGVWTVLESGMLASMTFGVRKNATRSVIDIHVSDLTAAGPDGSAVQCGRSTISLSIRE